MQRNSPYTSNNNRPHITCKNCTTAVHNTAQNSSDNLPSYPPDNGHYSHSGRQPYKRDHLCNSADDKLFIKIRTSNHILHTLLPAQSTASQNYDLRQRVHTLQLPERSTHLSDRNFLMRMLYKNSYQAQLLFTFYYLLGIATVFSSQSLDCISRVLACVLSCLIYNKMM